MRQPRFSFRWGLFRAAFLLVLVPALALASPTYYVDGTNGDDSRTSLQAQDPATPWKTIKKAVATAGLIGIQNGVPIDGYTVIVQPGTYMESVESKRDSLAAAPVIIRAASPGSVTILPPPGTNGFFISHHYHVVDGFVVTGAVNGLKMGPHDGGDGPVNGLVAQNNQVHSNSNNGIQFTNAQNSVAAFNAVYQNGQSGIRYSGNGSAIHDNLVHDNGLYGIYIPDGVNHQVWNNTAYNNASGDIKILGSQTNPPGGRTFYVGLNGNDAYTDLQAQNPATPWKTILRALQGTYPGDTLLILPGTYTKIESVRDGTVNQPITIRPAEPGTVTIAPGSGSGVYIGHHYHIVENLTVTGGGTGLQMGPYKSTSGQVLGLVARSNQVQGSGIGIKFTNVVNATAMHNVIFNNGKDGIAYLWGSPCPSGSGATIFNNLVYGNGRNLSGEYGITVGCGNDHEIINNTLYGNVNGGIRLGVSGSVPVFGTVLNNIVAGSPVGIKEPAGSSYTGWVVLDFNDVYGNTTNYALGPVTKPGPNSISAPPGFVDPSSGDFGLGRVATGQALDSPCIDRGSDTADLVGLGGRTAFIDKYPDIGRVDLGYHGTALYPSQGIATINQATLTLDQNGAGFTLSANLKPGIGGDDINPGVDYAEVSFGELSLPLWITGFQQQGSQWVYTGTNGGVSSAMLQTLADGSVDFTVEATGLTLTTLKIPTSISLRIGDDYGSASVPWVGTIQSP